MLTTQRRPSSYPNKGMSPAKGERTTTCTEESSSILKQFPQHLLEESPPNTKDTRKCSVRKNCKDCPNTPFGITPSNYSQGLPHHYLDSSSLLHRARLPKHKSLWLNT